MIKLMIEGHVYNKFECVLANSYRAVDLLKMLSSIHKDSPYLVKNIEVEIDKNIVGRQYCVCDNSYCINLANGKYAYLVQNYNCNKDEKGAEFIIIKKPYIKKITNFIGSFYYIFVNVVSTKTGNLYRVIYNEDWVLGYVKK